MARLVSTSFSDFVFDTPEEAEFARTFTDLNKMYFCSLRASYAELKIKMPFDPEHPIKYAQAEASLAGKLELLDQLINPSKVETSEDD